MTKRIIAIAFIFVCASVAWAILGGTIFTRTYSLDAVAENRVASTWGTPQNQAPPSASFTRIVPKSEETSRTARRRSRRSRNCDHDVAVGEQRD